MKNIHVLKTDKPSKLYFNHNKEFEKYQFSKEPFINGLTNTTNQHIYITSSDEEIKEGDWFYLDMSHSNTLPDEIHQMGNDKWSKTGGIHFCEGNTWVDSCKKIILTDNKDLIKDGVQAIDDEFLEWFVKNQSCEEVKVEKFHGINTSIAEINAISGDNSSNWQGRSDLRDYKIIIPKEETENICIQTGLPCGMQCLSEEVCKRPKQETLEEFVFKVPFNYNIKSKEVIDMCMKEQENIILTWRLGHFIDMINSLPDDTEKNRILKSVFNNRQGELLLESYKLMKSHYEK